MLMIEHDPRCRVRATTTALEEAERTSLIG